MFTCKICKKKFTELTGLYNHIECKHKEMIPKNMSVQQYYYYMKTGRSNGNCVMCKQPTSWNGNTNKYNRFCDDPKCKEEYAKEFKKRMIGKYGKVHLLNDPEKQREMLAKRKISGKYRWDNGKETTYTGSYELDFLKTLDGFFDWDPSDIMMPSPHNYVYKYQGEDKIYIPDVFIPSLDLEIEIKDGGDNPNRHHKIQDVDKVKEKNKDEIMMSQKAFHYIKITNKNYTNFFNFLAEAKASFEKHGDSKKMPRIFKIEDIRTKPEVVNEGLTDIVGQLNNITMSDMDGIISYNINRKSKNQPELKKYMLGLIKPCKDLNDIEVIRKHAKKVADEVNKLGKKKEYKQECQEFMDWLDDEFNKELNKQMNKLNKSVKESMEVVEENYIDRALVWFDKPKEKLRNAEISLYHGSIDNITNDVLTPSGVNVGATKYSTPRWSTYYWDNYESAISWGMTWAVKKHTGLPIAYRGAVGKTLICNNTGLGDDEFKKSLINEKICSYVYEVRIKTSELEIGSVPSIKEYTLSRECEIYRKTKVTLNNNIFDKYFQLATMEEIEEIQNLKVSDLKAVRTKILNSILNNYRDPYRLIVRRDLKKGIINVGDDISHYKGRINKAIKNDEMCLKESSISYSRLNEYLQDDTNQRMAEYLDTYFNYYKKMCKEKPDARPHINNDVKKAKQFVLDLDKKGKIDLDMTTYTINRLDKILGESYGSSNECSNSIKIDLVYDPKKYPRQAFMLKDSDSKLYINEGFYIQRLDDHKKPGSCKTGFDITMDTEGKKVLEFVVTLPEPVDISKKLNELNSQEIKINGLFNPKDNNKLFLQEVCRILGVEGTITRVSDFLY